MSLVARPPTTLPKKSQAGLVLAMGTLYVLWSSTYLAIRIGVHELPPLGMAGWRFLVAGAILLAVLLIRKEALPTLSQARNAAFIGLFLVVGGNGLVTVAEKTVASGTAAILVATSSLWTTLLAGFLGIRPRPLEWIGIAVGMAGIVLLNAKNVSLETSPLGVSLVLLASLLWAAGSILSLRIEMPKSGLMSTAVQMLGAGLVLAVASPLFGESVPAAPSASAILAWAYLVLAGLAGFTAYNYALRNARPAVATSYVYVNPVLAVLLGAVMLGESVTGYTIAAMGLVVAGVGFVLFAKTR